MLLLPHSLQINHKAQHDSLVLFSAASTKHTAAAVEFAGASPVPLSPAVKSSWDSGKGIKWFRRELEYSYDILVENLVDPGELLPERYGSCHM